MLPLNENFRARPSKCVTIGIYNNPPFGAGGDDLIAQTAFEGLIFYCIGQYIFAIGALHQRIILTGAKCYCQTTNCDKPQGGLMFLKPLLKPLYQFLFHAQFPLTFISLAKGQNP